LEDLGSRGDVEMGESGALDESSRFLSISGIRCKSYDPKTKFA